MTTCECMINKEVNAFSTSCPCRCSERRQREKKNQRKMLLKNIFSTFHSQSIQSKHCHRITLRKYFPCSFQLASCCLHSPIFVFTTIVFVSRTTSAVNREGKTERLHWWRGTGIDHTCNRYLYTCMLFRFTMRNPHLILYLCWYRLQRTQYLHVSNKFSKYFHLQLNFKAYWG